MEYRAYSIRARPVCIRIFLVFHRGNPCKATLHPSHGLCTLICADRRYPSNKEFMRSVDQGFFYFTEDIGAGLAQVRYRLMVLPCIRLKTLLAEGTVREEADQRHLIRTYQIDTEPACICDDLMCLAIPIDRNKHGGRGH